MIGIYDITSFGARTEANDNTDSIQQAIDAAHAAGGGKVIVPSGTFRTGTLWMKSNVNMHLMAGAVLKGCDDIAAFYRGGFNRGMIIAYEERNMVLSGKGVIDGNGAHFHLEGQRHYSNDIDRSLTRQGDAYLADTTGKPDGPIAFTRRPGMMVVFKSCENVRVEDVTLRASPEWTLRFSECDRVWVEGITLDADMRIPNSDGVHLTSSSNVFISNCYISAGDDAIAVTGFTNSVGVDPGDGIKFAPEALTSKICGNGGGVCENIIVSNCILRTRSAGVRVGYGDSPVRNCQFHHLRIYDTNRGVAIFARDGADIEHISFSDITMDLRLIGGWWGHGEPLHVSSIAQNADRPGGHIRDVHFERITARAENGAVIWAEDPGAIQNVHLHDLDLTIHTGAQTAEFGGNFDFRPTLQMETNVFAHDIPGVHIERAKGVDISGLRIRWEGDLPSYFTGGVNAVDVDGLRIRDYDGVGAHGDALQLTRCDDAMLE